MKKKILLLVLVISLVLASCIGGRDFTQAVYLPEDIIYIDYKELSISFESMEPPRYYTSLEALKEAVEMISAESTNPGCYECSEVYMIYVEEGEVFYEFAYLYSGQDKITYVLDYSDESLSIETIINTLNVFYGEGNFNFQIR